MTERFVLYEPARQLYHCGSFLDADWRRAYLFHSVQFARQGLMNSLVDLGVKQSWRILRVAVDWDEFGDLVKLDVAEEIAPFAKG